MNTPSVETPELLKLERDILKIRIHKFLLKAGCAYERATRIRFTGSRVYDDADFDAVIFELCQDDKIERRPVSNSAAMLICIGDGKQNQPTE
ncbi:MAG TPA: hypothetical protein VH079_02200 [Terriglobales bacterium]|nr:hypothetical protein [Terriglobales bacterium]